MGVVGDMQIGVIEMHEPRETISLWSGLNSMAALLFIYRSGRGEGEEKPHHDDVANQSITISMNEV